MSSTKSKMHRLIMYTQHEDDTQTCLHEQTTAVTIPLCWDKRLGLCGVESSRNCNTCYANISTTLSTPSPFRIVQKRTTVCTRWCSYLFTIRTQLHPMLTLHMLQSFSVTPARSNFNVHYHALIVLFSGIPSQAAYETHKIAFCGDSESHKTHGVGNNSAHSAG